MREMKFISWETCHGKARTITINYDLLNKMSKKYDETIGPEPTSEQEPEVVQDTVAKEKPKDVDITNRIVSFLVDKGTTIELDYIDEIRDSICNGDDELRRRCTRDAKRIIIEKNLLNETA